MGDWILITSEDLPTLPHVASKVLSVVGDPGSSAADLQTVIEADQSLTERLLRMANSALFGGNSKITSLRAAVTRLGFNRVRNLVLIASTKDVFRSSDKLAEELWKHSLGVAMGARLVAQQLKLPVPVQDDLFLAGLFHDIGKVLINNQKPDRYTEVVQVAMEQMRPTSEVEQEVFKFSHEEVGVMIIQKWNLPAFLIPPIRFHHLIQDESRTASVEDEQNVAIIATADQIANSLGIGILNSATVDALSARSTRLLGLTDEQILPIMEQLPNLYLEQVGAFS